MTDFNDFPPNYSTPAEPLAGFHGPTSKGREGEEERGWKGGDRREGQGVGKKGRGYPVFP